jgi:heat shock protein HslJ
VARGLPHLAARRREHARSPDAGLGRDPHRPGSTRWRLTTVTTGWAPSPSPSPSVGPTDAVAKTELLFLDGTVRGTTGCATFTAPARIEGAVVTFGALTVDRDGCKPKDRTDLDALEAVLSGAVSARVNEDSLSLIHPSRRGLTFEAAASRQAE